MSENKVTLEVSQELYDSINQLKKVFSEITWQQIENDEEVLSIIVWGFIESITAENAAMDMDGHSHGDHECQCGGHCHDKE